MKKHKILFLAIFSSSLMLAGDETNLVDKSVDPAAYARECYSNFRRLQAEQTVENSEDEVNSVAESTGPRAYALAAWECYSNFCRNKKEEDTREAFPIINEVFADAYAEDHSNNK